MAISIVIDKNAAKKVQSGYPWIYLDWIKAQTLLIDCIGGEITHIYDHKGKFLGSGLIEPNSKIAIRVLTSQKIDHFTTDFFTQALNNCLKKRSRFLNPYYRLVNSEGDHLPGLIIDRFDNIFSIHFATIAMFKFKDIVLESLHNLFNATQFVIRTTGLEEPLTIGSIPEIIEVKENDTTYLANLTLGQKTGWYYDQHENRKMVALLSAGLNVLDAFCYNGGFGLLCAKHKASHITFIDSSAQAINLTKQALEINNLKNYATFINQDVLKSLNALKEEGIKFDIVILDPPPFIKSKANKPSALAAYKKLAEAGLRLLSSHGLLFFSTCSHHMSLKDLKTQVLLAAKALNLKIAFKMLTTHAKDHPIHPHLPESQYLNSVLIKLVN